MITVDLKRDDKNVNLPLAKEIIITQDHEKCCTLLLISETASDMEKSFTRKEFAELLDELQFIYNTKSDYEDFVIKSVRPALGPEIVQAKD